jgi:hypothetical protein
MVDKKELPVDLKPACQTEPIKCGDVLTVEDPAYVFDLPVCRVV